MVKTRKTKTLEVEWPVLRRNALKGEYWCRGSSTCIMHLSKFSFTRFMTIDELIDHLRTVHEKNTDIVNKTFATMPDFKEWKEGYETASFSLFVLHSERMGYVCYYYYCNRTSKYTSRGTGKRGLKIQGTSKLESHCTSFIRARKYESGVVKVEMC